MKLFDYCAHPTRINDVLIEAPLQGVFIGEVCAIERSVADAEIIGKAQVIGFHSGKTQLSLIGRAKGLSLEVVLRPTGKAYQFLMGEHLLGKAYKASGEAICSFSDQSMDAAPMTPTEWRCIDSPPPEMTLRHPINSQFSTGIRAVDGLLTCGKGQRFGIFASAGAGKTSLMNMIIAHSDADVCIVALVGERGREVTEFIHELSSSPRRDSTILVYATSDSPSIERCNAALLATAMAEYFRDLGRNVVLFVDSMTRYARALRDVALAAGELPARRGYPASVFERLPSLLERPGNMQNGSITAFYTVLLESEDEPDPIGDEIRSILDGHIYLSYKLAGRGHYPAIDILSSISRVFPQITTDSHRKSAAEMRDMLARLDEIQLYLDLGEYQRGENPANDRALDRKSEIEAFLRQSMAMNSPFEETQKALNGLIS
ncbi:type III secretion system ATPase SctN [Yersinia ruckeri]|uniref:type III secretion system ATPase SctN n=1 Tax=Yersinia ruckeri TaxID=29486 RepID=UPI0020BF2271|nr:type III secretion system ATPase SctN [Yersinia ruckeri]MCK8566234.1 type III secretion system ATPase SctN [Yersinia ruckeri]MCW6540663.1 type III secretion system ATPase SctN [Yersinia ruckeri]UZY10806.1 type III secretion system ATPase SctN [Yersinia ruckeri]UZY17792.1 type III secretion system ATPase SctN [Yersinia ruckeri]